MTPGNREIVRNARHSGATGHGVLSRARNPGLNIR